MSGGVDSSVAALLLQQAAHEVVGVFMRHGVPVEDPCRTSNSSQLPILGVNQQQGCCTAEDAEDARRVASALDIPFYALNLDQDFGKIIDYFVAEYSSGRTPNPCVMCNNWIKFGKLFDYADSIGAEFVATGHYARLLATPSADIPELHRAVDGHKDQSYVLFGVDRHRFGRMLLPVGAYTKREIRRFAEQHGLRVAGKRDSQEICFVSPGQHPQFVANQIDKDTSGHLVTVDGDVVGQHDGIQNFTIGQRKGLGVALGEPHFVVAIDARTCIVTIGTREDLKTTSLTASRANWLWDPPRHCEVQIRYNSLPAPAEVRVQGDRFDVIFDEPCYGVAPGQAAVCYDGTRVLGGGWIESTRCTQPILAPRKTTTTRPSPIRTRPGLDLGSGR